MRTDEFYMNYFQLSDKELIRQLTDCSKQKAVKKGEVVAREGEIQSWAYFLLSGVFRGYFLDTKGRDITDCFGFRCGDPVIACIKFGEPSIISIEALTDGKLLAIPVANLLELLRDSTQMLETYNQFLMERLRYHWSMKALIYQCSAMERYRWFLEHYPGLAERVSGKHVASLLGMTSVTLSRLKRVLREGQTQQN